MKLSNDLLRRVCLLSLSLVLSLALASTASAQKKKKKDESSTPVPSVTVPDEHKINTDNREMLTACNLSDI